MEVKFVDLKREYYSIKGEVDKAVQDVLDSTRFIGGENVERFERKFAKFCDVKYAAAVGSGTDALKLVVQAIGINSGEVITVPNTFISTVDSIYYNDATPIFVDIKEKTYNINVDNVEEKITKKTKMILPVHLFGQMCLMDQIMEIADKYGVVVLEDACQAHGAEYKGKRAGSFGDAACFSFYPSKNIGAYGDAGIIVTNNKELCEKIKMMRNYGQSQKYHHDFPGYNSRMDALQAAILLVKMKYVEKWNKMRRKNAKLYNELLTEIKGVITPFEHKDCKHVYYVYVIRVKKRDKLREFLKSKGVESGVHYPIPIHLLKAYSYLGLGPGSFPVAERVAKEILSLPMFPLLKEEEIQYVVDCIKEFVKKEI